MRCNPHVVSRFIDGELDRDRHDEMVRHLQTCPDCRREVTDLKRVNQALYSWGAVRRPIPAATEHRVRVSIERRRKLAPLFRLARFSPPAVGSSVAALLLLLMVNLGPVYQSAAPPAVAKAQVAPVIKRQAGPLQLARGRAAVVATKPDSTQLFLVHHHFEALVN